MESQDKEKEYERNIWEIYRKEFATANREKRLQLNRRMRRWQELMKNGWSANQAYSKVMEEPQETPHSYPFWTKMRKAFVVIPVLALVAAIVYGIVVTGEIDTLKTELESAQSVLASTQSELGSTKETLASTQSELTSTQSELVSTQLDLDSTEQTLTTTQAELSSTEQRLSLTQAELTSTNQELSSAQQDLTNLQGTLSSTQQQLAVAQETLEGLGITLSRSGECSDVNLIDNPTATNPSWSQLVAFLYRDITENNTYIRGVYDCSQFSMDIHNNAEAAGIRAAEVQLWFEFPDNEEGHAANAFLTTDYGLVYVDCTRAPDKIARIKTGQEYRAVELYQVIGININNIGNDHWWDTLSSYRYIPSSFSSPWNIRGAVTSSIEIYW